MARDGRGMRGSSSGRPEGRPGSSGRPARGMRGGSSAESPQASGSGLTGAAGDAFSSLSGHFASRRLAIVAVIFLAAAAVFLVRLVGLQVFLSADYAARASESRTVSFDITPRRGTIYDRNGVAIATSVDATTIYCNPAEVTDVDYEASKIASVLGGEPADYVEALSRDKTTFAYLERQADVDKADELRKLDLDGVYFIDDTRREYPNGSVGGQVIGLCNVDGEGIIGLELQYDEILRGTPGTYSAERGEGGIPIPGGVHEDVPAIDGTDIMVSLDIKLQDSVEQALAAGIADPVIAGERGTAVVMDASTGEIYAICSPPYMNPADMENSEIGSENLTAITQAFEPGSVFKSVSALAVLESGSMVPEDELFCPSFITADEYEVSDAHDRGDETMTLREILDKSSNVGISLAVENAGFDKLVGIIERSGLNDVTGVDFPGESAGFMQDFDVWAKITGYNVSFGQGIAVTPLQMARFYAVVENGGTAVTPHFLISLPQTGERPEYETELVTDDAEAIENLSSMMRTVVTDGTGTAADIPGYEVVGKTSTAEVARDGAYVEGLYNLCFAGFIDKSSSHLVCFVSANEVYSQASVASIFKAIMSSAIEQYNIVSE